MKDLKCLVVDDEELARELLQNYIDRLPYLQLCGSYANPIHALEKLKHEKIDVLFLDIQMPELKGVELAKLLPREVKVIFTTAYAEYALQGYEVNALDYLLKPITFERFLKAVEKINEGAKDVESSDTITVKSGYDLYKLRLEDINYVESDSEYVIYHTDKKKIMCNQSLSELELKLSDKGFLRVHRSYIVNKHKVDGMQGKELFVAEKRIPVSNSYFKKVKDEIFAP